MAHHDRHSHSSAPSDEANLFLDVLQEAPLSGHRRPTSILGSVLYCILLASASSALHKCRLCYYGCSSSMDIFLDSQISSVIALQLQCHSFANNRCFSAISVLPSQKSALAGTALMLLVMVWQPHINILSVSTLLRIIMFVEVICAGSFMSIYIGCVHQYNSLDRQPDVLKSLYSALQPSSSLEELRYHDGGRLSDQQMALLQYQRENLHYLNEEILRLQECLSKYERSDDGSTPQVDLAHLLAARDQELRALSAEMNQMQSELRLARNLIAERDSEVQSIRITNNQYVEENERLRAILGEWSARAAKLERALEAERLLNMELQKKISKLRNHPTESSEQHGD
ncbi:protein FIP1-like isoform X3 [Magnolia sinica]|uniref:protein FIP1-like isoform X3 n=1 Tax=Magnolia sinica TaxID=86752 RepID=UPI002658B0F8|nr:protein FIP1-like isoform X3 [Magnolia sinica]